MSTAASSPIRAALDGRGIVVTRPRGQCAELVALIKAVGGRAIVFPALEIVEPSNRRTLNTLIDRLDQFDLAIFISPTAVDRALNLIRARRVLPAGLRIAAIGKGSARELRRCQVENVLTPEGRFDSEALLALNEFQEARGKSIVIFRGEGGRELLGNTLVERGAKIEYAECYRRVRPNGDSQQLLKAWARGEIHAITVTSSEALRNLFDMVGTLGRHWLRKTPLFVPHERIAAVARELGIANVVVTAQGDAGLIEGIIQTFAGERLE
jgi:uroporphyrinogen-III synthase